MKKKIITVETWGNVFIDDQTYAMNHYHKVLISKSL